MADTKKDKTEKSAPAEFKHDLSSAEMVKSYVISLAIALPSIGLTYYLAYLNRNWPAAHVIFAGILIVSIVNFVALAALEEYRSRIGSFTVPVLVAASAVVLLILLLTAVNRFVPAIGYQWVFPAVLFVIVFKYLALFREKNLALKFYLAVNIIALAALWGMGIHGKIALPF